MIKIKPAILKDLGAVCFARGRICRTSIELAIVETAYADEHVSEPAKSVTINNVAGVKELRNLCNELLAQLEEGLKELGN